jgi:hypothetical protein
MEFLGHISSLQKDFIDILPKLKTRGVIARLVTVQPYKVNGDEIISVPTFEEEETLPIDALIIRSTVQCLDCINYTGMLV